MEKWKVEERKYSPVHGALVVNTFIPERTHTPQSLDLDEWIRKFHEDAFSPGILAFHPFLSLFISTSTCRAEVDSMSLKLREGSVQVWGTVVGFSLCSSNLL